MTTTRLALQALEHYSRAIELDDSLLVARNNRAMTRLKLGQWEGALQDSQAVIDREPTNVKALLRLGNARHALTSEIMHGIGNTRLLQCWSTCSEEGKESEDCFTMSADRA